MSRKQKLVAVVFGAFATVVTLVVVASQIRPAREISVSISGNPGQELTATFLVDGQQHQELLTTPVKRTFHASTLQFWIDRNTNPQMPELTVETTVDGKLFGTAQSNEPDQCAYGGVRTSSLFRLRRECSYTHPAPQEVVAQLVTPPGFPAH